MVLFKIPSRSPSPLPSTAIHYPEPPATTPEPQFVFPFPRALPVAPIQIADPTPLPKIRVSFLDHDDEWHFVAAIHDPDEGSDCYEASGVRDYFVAAPLPSPPPPSSPFAALFVLVKFVEITNVNPMPSEYFVFGTHPAAGVLCRRVSNGVHSDWTGPVAQPLHLPVKTYALGIK